LRRFNDAVLAFWRDPFVPFDSNLAECDLGMLSLLPWLILPSSLFLSRPFEYF
jgi:hypothetical protein